MTIEQPRRTPDCRTRRRDLSWDLWDRAVTTSLDADDARRGAEWNPLLKVKAVALDAKYSAERFASDLLQSDK